MPGTSNLSLENYGKFLNRSFSSIRWLVNEIVADPIDSEENKQKESSN